MAGLVGLIKAKPLKPVLSATSNNPYAMAMQIPAESDRIFDGELKLLLMDGLSQIPPNLHILTCQAFLLPFIATNLKLSVRSLLIFVDKNVM